MPRSDDDESAADVDPTYLAIYSEHVLQFRTHLAGKHEGEQLPASFFAPRAFWSAAEKDAFFHGLAVHSRLRPDLIAEEIKTKTVADVLVYVALLEQGDTEDSKSGVHVGEHARLHRKDHPCAVEVSDRWLAFEERMADAMMVFQSSLDQAAIAHKRDAEVHVRKNAVRAPKGRGRTASQARDREGEKARREEFEQWLAQRRKEWESEDMLLSLDKADLTTLDRMLREDEEGRGVVAEANVHLTDHEEVHPSEMTHVDDVAEQGPSAHTVSGLAEEAIDPALLALSGIGSMSSTVRSRNLETDSFGPPEVSSSMPPLALPLPPIADAYHPQTLAAVKAPLPTPESPSLVPLPSSSSAPSVTEGGSTIDGEDVSQMSPASRRRYQKRLYMRRKRAQAAGTTPIQNAERLKPGRRPKQQSAQVHTPAPGVSNTSGQTAPCDGSVARSVGAVGGEMGVDGTHRHQPVSGTTLPYKRQAQLISKGIDVQRLRKEGLDLFHLQAICKLMGTYNQLHDVPQSISSAISAETFKLLRALVVRFVSEVMSRAIVSREQERIAKLQTKAWRLRENQVVSTANVKHALALYGADSLDKSAQFKGLLRKLDLDHSDQDVAAEDESGEDDLPDELQHIRDGRSCSAEEGDPVTEDADVAPLSLEPLSSLRAIFPPFVNPPASGLYVGEVLDSLDPSVYMPWPSSSLLSTFTEPTYDDDLLPEETDDVAYTRELDEDKALDRVDSHRDAESEKALWVRIAAAPLGEQNESQSQSTTDDKPASAQPCTMRQTPRKRKRQSVDADGSRERWTDDGSASERAVKAGLLGEDADAVEDIVPRGRRKKKAKAKASMSDKQLWFQEPAPDGRIKSAVYILDSD